MKMKRNLSKRISFLQSSELIRELTRGRVDVYEGKNRLVYVDALTREFVSTEYVHNLINALKEESGKKEHQINNL
jgi:hypothetical protein